MPTPSSPGAGSSDGGSGGGSGLANTYTGGCGDEGNGFDDLHSMAGLLIASEVLKHQDHFVDSVKVVAGRDLKEALATITKDHTDQHPDGAVIFMTDASDQLFTANGMKLSGAGSIAMNLAWKVGGIDSLICMVSEQPLLSRRLLWV